MIRATIFTTTLLVLLVRPVSSQTFTAVLNGSQENPPVATNGTGNGTATFDATTNMLAVHVDFTGLNGVTTDSHIHCCTTTNLNTSVAIGFTSTFPLGVSSGNYNNTFDLLNPATYTSGFLTSSGGTAAQARDRLIAAFSADPNNPASVRAYFNIHTTTTGSGEIRGNIRPVPEPTSWSCMLVGLVTAALRRRR